MVDFGIDLWLDTLCRRTERALPHLHSDLSARLGNMGMGFSNGTHHLIAKPDIILRDSLIVQSLVGSYDVDACPRNTSLPAGQQGPSQQVRDPWETL